MRVELEIAYREGFLRRVLEVGEGSTATLLDALEELRAGRPGGAGAESAGAGDSPAAPGATIAGAATAGAALDAATAGAATAGAAPGTPLPDLLYRHSCHHGSCGTCGALVAGVERLMCLTPLASLGPGPVRVEPLRKATRLGGLAVEPGPLFDSLPEASYLRASEVAHGAPRLAADEGESRGAPGDSPEQGSTVSGAPRGDAPRGDAPLGCRRMEACIECGLCLSACPVPEERPFSGPAALAAADRDREERPERSAAALAFAARPDGVSACDRKFACSKACPQGVAPGRRIERLRKDLAARG